VHHHEKSPKPYTLVCHKLPIGHEDSSMYNIQKLGAQILAGLVFISRKV